MPNGATTKVLWLVSKSDGTGNLLVTGKHLSKDGAFQQTFPSAADGSQFPSILDIPTLGCWQLNLKRGTHLATVTLWVIGD